MPVSVSYPGVYIDEVPGGSRAIAGVPTSVAAFVGYSRRGPTDEATQIFSFADFERTFGELHPSSALSYAVNHFFLNGGATAWIVRVAEDATAASVTMDSPGTDPTLEIQAASEGAWGNNLQLLVDYDTSNPDSTFNLTVNEMREVGGQLVVARSEVHRNLSMNPDSSNYAFDAVNDASRMVEIANDIAATTGTATVISGAIDDSVVSGLQDNQRRIGVQINGGPVEEFNLFDPGAPLADVATAAGDIQEEIRTIMGNNDFTMVENNGRLEGTLAQNATNTSIRFVPASINSGTAALRLTVGSGAREADIFADTRPMPTGTVGERRPDFDGPGFDANLQLRVDVLDASDTVVAQTGDYAFPEAPASLSGAAAMLQAELRATDHPAFRAATATVSDDRITLRASPDTPTMRLRVVGIAGSDAATPLGIDQSIATTNLATYRMGTPPLVAAQSAVNAGADGTEPDPNTVTGLDLYLGDQDNKTGIFALEDADLFNILNLPDISQIDILTAAVTYAEERRSMILIDLDENVRDIEDARDWVNNAANSGLKHRNSAIYFPRLMMGDPVQGGRLRPFPNSGVIAGLWARTDSERGVWKAPAGIDARLRGVQALDYRMTDPENGVLNPLGVNCLRTFPVYGTVSWGSRTLVGADVFASEWKYVPVRRLALYIEESLYRGTQFVVFEPNDEPLWSQIRLSVGSFMQQLFRQGALQGSTPQEAYLVRCDSSTTTQADIDLGIVNIYVGFAPLKPAEFVVIQIQQLAGQSQS
ncbi:phage tail sheath family protein [Ruegeria arenilitoris]|uniref:phage tail sheath family protein n=1 Tax=Ruegeria arenilitoris TaxID=1173585 RepID=UPI001C2BD616|nr:phage tail sheath C-terminal domain-containing protein [Ruegeria arenilitoris]